MPKCDLSIELDDPSFIYGGGEKISGTLRVTVDKDVNCKGLVVTSGWRTHGRGNVTSGTTQTETLFEGQWRAGDKIEYPFELQIDDWPPSYHGNYLNVDHYIDARAKIPWGFDPKASQAFLMRPTCGPEGAAAEKPTDLTSKIGCILGTVFMAIFAAIFIGGFAIGGMPLPILLVFLLIPLAGATFFFVRVFLPKYLLGSVECSLTPEQVSPGDVVRGELLIRPRKNVSINAIKMTFRASEKVVSGSGTNQTTHTNVFFEKETTLQGESILQAGQEHRVPLSVELPGDAPYSIKLTHNELIWSTFLRVDIPRWPDWTKALPISVVPSGEQVAERSSAQVASRASLASPVEDDVTGQDSPSVITFAETAQHLWSLREDQESLDDLVDAVSGLTFDVDAVVERRLLYSGDEDPHLYENGYAIWGHYPEPPLPMVLYIPKDLADDFEQIGRGVWKGRGTVVGWDHQHRRLQVKVESSSF